MWPTWWTPAVRRSGSFSDARCAEPRRRSLGRSWALVPGLCSNLVILNQQPLLHDLLFLPHSSAGKRAVLELMPGWHPRVGGGSSKFTAQERRRMFTSIWLDVSDVDVATLRRMPLLLIPVILALLCHLSPLLPPVSIDVAIPLQCGGGYSCGAPNRPSAQPGRPFRTDEAGTPWWSYSLSILSLLPLAPVASSRSVRGRPTGGGCVVVTETVPRGRACLATRCFSR